jgi:hypothetical protein
MFSTQLSSYPDSIVPVSRRKALAELAAIVVAGVAAILIALSLAGSHRASSAPALPQVRDMAPAWNLTNGASARAGSAATPPFTHTTPVVRVRP